MTNHGVIGATTPGERLRGLHNVSAADYGSTPVYDPISNAYKLRKGATYDTSMSAYNVTGSSLGRFRAQVAKALTSTTPATIVCLGDSITQGNTSTPQRNYNWPNYLRSILSASGRVGLVGEGAAFYTGKASTYDERWTLGTGWSTGGWGLINSSLVQGNPAAAGVMTFTLPTCDSVTIIYARFSFGGSWTWQIDGGSATTVNANGAAATLGTTFSVSSGTHTLTINAPATNYALILGIRWSNSAAINDVEVFTGGGLAGITSTAAIPDVPGAGIGNLSMLDYLQPDLTIVSLGRNDSSPVSGINMATYYATMETLVKRMRVTNSKDILLLTPPPVSATYALDAPMMQALYKLADTYDVGLIDLHDRFGSSWSTTPYSMSSDNLHPNDAGHRLIGQTVANVLLSAV